MGATVINNSKSIQDYRGQIAHAIDELKLQFGKTESAIEAVYKGGWKDDNFREFQNHFNEDKEQILPLCDKLYDYENNILYQLQEKLRKLEERSFRL